MGRKFSILILVLCVFAFGIRLIVSYELQQYDPQVTIPSPDTDMYTYKDAAEKILSGEFSGLFYYQPFYYAVFLPFSHILFGKSIWAVLLMQSLLSALCVALGAFASAKIFGRKAGIITAILICFSTMMILYVPYMLLEILQAFWLTLLLFISIKAIEKRSAFYWCVAGLVMGCSILTRGNIWIMLPGIIFAACASTLSLKGTSIPKSKLVLRALKISIAIIVFTVLPQIPFIWHNSVLLGQLSGPSTASDAVLALGNTPEAPPGGRNPGSGPGPMEYPPSYNIWMDKNSGKSVPAHIIEWIKSEPLAFAELSFRKLLLFWDSREIPNNIAVEYNGQKSMILHFCGLVPTALILTMAIAGLFVFARKSFRNLKLFMLVYMTAAFWIAVAAFYILCRFRVPIIPILAVLAGGFFNFAYIEVRKMHFKKLIICWIPPLLIAFAIVTAAYDLYRYEFESGVMRFVRPSGIKVNIKSPGKPDSLMLLDNGPLTFGAWNTCPFREGDCIKKTFRFNSAEKSETPLAKLILYTLWQNAGSADFEVNGSKITVNSERPGFVESVFEIPASPNWTYSIKFLSSNTTISYILDFQREYGRTFINTVNPGAELVTRLYLTPAASGKN